MRREFLRQPDPNNVIPSTLTFNPLDSKNLCDIPSQSLVGAYYLYEVAWITASQLPVPIITAYFYYVNFDTTGHQIYPVISYDTTIHWSVQFYKCGLYASPPLDTNYKSKILPLVITIHSRPWEQIFHIHEKMGFMTWVKFCSNLNKRLSGFICMVSFYNCIISLCAQK